MFGKHKDSRGGWDPELAAKYDRLNALTLPQLGAAVMAQGFAVEEGPGAYGPDADGIAYGFSPTPPANIRDSTIHGQQQAFREANDPTSDRYKWLQLKELVAEGLQALEQASLVHQNSQFDGVATNIGYVPTRLGREALAQGAVERILSGGSL
jgi:hypothetical protein